MLIYNGGTDDDGNSTLDTTEVESLLRFIYQTETLSSKDTSMLNAACPDKNKSISRGALAAASISF